MLSPFKTLAALAVLTGWGCNAHPVEPVDASLQAVDRLENRLPAKTKLDFLFVVDDSGSMCEEQERLAEDFRLFSSFLFDELQGAADYRIAVVNTDLGHRDDPPAKGHLPGAFLYLPALGPQSCQGVQGQYIPRTDDCEPHGAAEPVISSAQIEGTLAGEALSEPDRSTQLKAELERQFRCRATLGTSGGGREKGLEAMRRALSCTGPNAELFSSCCVNPGTDQAFYNPACTASGADEPLFLRPDATLIVLIISDEDDCSTPSDAPLDTSRLICRQGSLVDADADGVPDIYTEYCPNPRDCYERECGSYVASGPQSCYDERCYIDEPLCDQKRGALSSVREYKDFLYSLKARPFDQLLVAPLVGFRTYTEQGNPHRYLSGMSPSFECTDNASPSYGTEACCPGGVCSGVDTPIESCNIPEQNVLAYGGWRYLDLADQLGLNALGCPSGEEPTFDPERGSFTTSERCISLCSEDLSAPLSVVKDRVASLVNTYCLERPPPCIVEEGEATRACEGSAELQDAGNYSLSVSISCQEGSCDPMAPRGSQSLSDEEWSLKLNDSGCPAEVILSTLPPAGSEVIIEFISSAEAIIDP